jgi:hypothetical protein
VAGRTPPADQSQSTFRQELEGYEQRRHKQHADKARQHHPPNTVVPMDWRAPAPAPVAITSGITPTKKASAVIITGR